MTKVLRSYPKVWNMGHPAIRDLFDGPVVVQEKVDGSQFSFGVVHGELFCRSKGASLNLETTDLLFRGAVETAKRLHEAGLLVEGWTYRGEAICRPKHNTLTYERAPTGNVILFDVDRGLEDRIADPDELAAVGFSLGLEVVPVIYHGEIRSADELAALIDRVSCLGGAKVEGVVAKNYARFGPDGKMLMGKVVSEAFREVHKKDWRERHPTRTDIVDEIIEEYRTEARWRKSVQHLREAGKLEGSPRDIGSLIKEVAADVRAECEDEIKDALFRHFWPKIQRGITHGLPDWYKAELAGAQFDREAA
jgi:hypothetical protein